MPQINALVLNFDTCPIPWPAQVDAHSPTYYEGLCILQGQNYYKKINLILFSQNILEGGYSLYDSLRMGTLNQICALC